MKITCMMSSLCLGGAERQIIALATTLARNGNEVEVLTYHKADFFAPNPETEGFTRFSIDDCRNDLSLCRKIASHLCRTGCELLIAFRAGTAMKACIIHKLYPGFRLFVSERNLNMGYHLHDRIRFRLFREAEKVICNNHSQEAFIRKVRPDLSNKLVTISNFVDLDNFSCQGRTGVGKPRRICVTARVVKRKNVHGLIKAARMLKDKGLDFRIEWYGLAHPDCYYRKCIRMIEEYGLTDRFRILPAVHDIAQKYRECDIFCLPSFYEGTSNSLAEALACGMPVVCSAVSDNVLYVSDAVNGFLCNPGSAASIAGALEKVLALSDGEIADFGRHGRAVAERKLDFTRFEKEYLALL